MTAKANEHFRIYVLVDPHLLKSGVGYVNIRVANRQDRNKSVDVAVYLSDGTRFKLKPPHLKEGKFANGDDEKRRDDINHYLDTLTNRLNAYTQKVQQFTKAELEVFLYGQEFINTHKKRVPNVEIKIYEPVPTDLHSELRQRHGKRRETLEIKKVDEEGFEVIENQQIIIDPLSLDDFPKNFPPTLYDKYKRETIAEIDDETKRNEYLQDNPQNKWFLDQRILFHIKSNRLLYDFKLKEVVKISESELKKYEAEHGKLQYLMNGEVFGSQRTALLARHEQRAKSKRTTEEKYSRGEWNKFNIFEIFGSIYYDPNCPKTYHKIVLRLLEYREHRKPKEDIKHLNAPWLIDFFLFLKENGWYTINTKNLDPLNYNKKIFFYEKEREAYKPKSLNKLIGIAKTLINGKDKFTFNKKGYIPRIDLADLSLAAITDEQDLDGTRIEHNLKKDEIDQLYYLLFDLVKLEEYQQIFDTVNKSKKIKITIEDLRTARNLFILQVFFGGLRGYIELSTAKLLKHGKEYVVTFYQNKVTNTVTNPLNAYTDGILKPLGYVIPSLERHNARKKNKKVSSIKLLEGHYRSLLKTIGHIVNFEREVLTDATKFVHSPIKDLFNPYFSRKTFGTICYAELHLTDSDISLFTGHKDMNPTELTSSYIQKNTVENKKRLLADLKIGANPNQ